MWVALRAMRLPRVTGEDTAIYKSRWPEAEVSTSYANPAGNLISSGTPSGFVALVRPALTRFLSNGLPKLFSSVRQGTQSAPALPF